MLGSLSHSASNKHHVFYLGLICGFVLKLLGLLYQKCFALAFWRAELGSCGVLFWLCYRSDLVKGAFADLDAPNTVTLTTACFSKAVN